MQSDPLWYQAQSVRRRVCKSPLLVRPYDSVPALRYRKMDHVCPKTPKVLAASFEAISATLDTRLRLCGSRKKDRFESVLVLERLEKRIHRSKGQGRTAQSSDHSQYVVIS